MGAEESSMPDELRSAQSPEKNFTGQKAEKSRQI